MYVFMVNFRYHNHNDRLSVNEISKCFAQRTRESFSTINESTNNRNIRHKKWKKNYNLFGTYVIYGRQVRCCIDRVHDLPVSSCFHRRGCRDPRGVVATTKGRRENCSPIQTTDQTTRKIEIATVRITRVSTTLSGSSLGSPRIKGPYFRPGCGAHQFPDHCTSTHCRLRRRSFPLLSARSPIQWKERNGRISGQELSRLLVQD